MPLDCDGVTRGAGTVVATLDAAQLAALTAKMKNEGVLYHGLQVLGGGSILGGLVLGAIAALIIERKFRNAAAFAAAGAALTFFGFMHGERIGIAQTPLVALSYFIVAGMLLLAAQLTAPVTRPAESLPDESAAHAA